MGKGFEQTFLQRICTNGQQAHEKTLNITNHQRNANQNYNITSHPLNRGARQATVHGFTRVRHDLETKPPPPPTAAAAAAAKSLQSCPTLCDPIDGSPPGSSVPGILQARTLEWVAISFSNAWERKVKVKSFSHVRLLMTPWTTAYQAPPSMDFSGKRTGVGCHCLLPTSYYCYQKEQITSEDVDK